MSEIPVFPLQTVLFPGGSLPLRLFETRYLDMLSRCLKEEQGFGVCLIVEGKETGPARTHPVGTEATIRDWGPGPEGLLHILAQGGRRFRVLSMRIQSDGLNLADVEWLPPEAATPLPETARPLAELLKGVVAQLESPYPAQDYGDAGWVAYRLAELLPLSLAQRQYLLELNDTAKRLEILATLVKSLAVK